MKNYNVVIYFFTTLANILTLLTMINQALYLASVSFSFLAFQPRPPCSSTWGGEHWQMLTFLSNTLHEFERWKKQGGGVKIISFGGLSDFHTGHRFMSGDFQADNTVQTLWSPRLENEEG